MRNNDESHLNPLRTFGFLLRDVSRRYVERFEQRAGALGLTLAQSKVLIYLADHEGISQVQLAELTDLEPMAMVRALDCLEAHGFLERRNDPVDRRARRLHLLERGKPLVDDIWHLVDLTRREAFAGLPKKQADLVIESLGKIQTNLAALQPLPEPVTPARNGRAGAARSRHERTGTRS